MNGTGHERAKSMTTYTVSDAVDDFYDIWLACYAGDIISHGHSTDSSYHSQIVYEWTTGPYDLKVAQHTGDYLQRSLKDYLEYREDILDQGDEYIFVIEIW